MSTIAGDRSPSQDSDTLLVLQNLVSFQQLIHSNSERRGSSKKRGRRPKSGKEAIASDPNLDDSPGTKRAKKRRISDKEKTEEDLDWDRAQTADRSAFSDGKRKLTLTAEYRSATEDEQRAMWEAKRIEIEEYRDEMGYSALAKHPDLHERMFDFIEQDVEPSLAQRNVEDDYEEEEYDDMVASGSEDGTGNAAADELEEQKRSFLDQIKKNETTERIGTAGARKILREQFLEAATEYKADRTAEKLANMVAKKGHWDSFEASIAREEQDAWNMAPIPDQVIDDAEDEEGSEDLLELEEESGQEEEGDDGSEMDDNDGNAQESKDRDGGASDGEQEAAEEADA
ncbi:unnamed protein product [Zymoseptoria tritici ST99CH_1E4]|uniref:Uncharacterized protein n=1 Tax=Zymoseptoria tritici ST99CH_1E4 TaxID=1276532 RepID=A0A2H1GXL0_ZYMTR|nr:unnamed protein product [Zymoseptoria tritici ST99CH_1E4]